MNPRDLGLGVLIALVIGQGVWLSHQERAVHGILTMLLPAQGGPGSALAGVPPISMSGYSGVARVEQVRAGEDPALEALLDRHDLTAEQRRATRELLADHLVRLNEIVLKEQAGLQDRDGSRLIADAERVRRLDALVDVLGVDLGSEVERDIQETWESGPQGR